jgi:hypothetical protein
MVRLCCLLGGDVIVFDAVLKKRDIHLSAFSGGYL